MHTPKRVRALGPYGFDMLKTIKLKNFRCYRDLSVSPCSLVNIIVGDNGSGKTALLESIFMALASSTEVAMRLRTLRGLDGPVGGANRRIEETLWGDFFHNYDFKNPISIELSGTGPEARSLEIRRNIAEDTLPLTADFSQPTSTAPVIFTWTDANGVPHPVIPRMGAGGLSMPQTGEDLPLFYFYSAQFFNSASNTADMFSRLSRLNKAKRFVNIFTKEFNWISDVSVESHGGSPVVFGSLKGSGNRFPITNMSSGLNRIFGIMLGICDESNGVVLADEIETGIYYKHLIPIWRAVLELCREYNTQIFVSTHSLECLEALQTAAGKSVKDITLWRTQRERNDFRIKRFSGQDLKLGIEYGEEIRG